MLKPLIAGLMALSLTLASTAPLQAEGLSREDSGKLLFGLTALAILGVALDRRDRDDEDTAAQPAHSSRGIDPNRSWSDLNHDQQRRNNARWVLPGNCLQTIPTRYGNQRMFGARCLDRNYRHVSRLPGRCAVRVYTDRGPREGFDPRCLREQGYRSDRRH